ncbi:MAG TPA: prepilin-type N-terminal cleavage/methylation domain-containing protein [Phycisphaerales bacterium]|nr:prepilin-type N-terminal cleavage/methylation domain-containing protein [Phycisphaerales bacterium]
MHRAFTLIELVVVLAVMAVAAAVAIPASVSTAGQYRANLASTRVGADMRRLQQDSWHNATTSSIVFSTAGDSYDLVNLEGSGATTTVHLGRSPYRVDLVSAQFDGVARVDFRAGVSSAASGGTVRVKASGVTFQATISGGQEARVASVARVGG